MARARVGTVLGTMEVINDNAHVTSSSITSIVPSTVPTLALAISEAAA